MFDSKDKIMFDFHFAFILGTCEAVCGLACIFHGTKMTVTYVEK